MASNSNNRDASSSFRGQVRAPSPASPSPSPEPSGDAAYTTAPGAAAAAAAPPSGPHLAYGNSAVNSISNPFDYTTGVNKFGLLTGDSSRRSGDQKDGQIPFHELLRLEEDTKDSLRRDTEDKTRSVIDSLYQLAVCAADVQPTREDLVGIKVNEVVSHLASLYSLAVGNQDLLPLVPEEVLEAIDEGRNPDVWSRNRMARLVSDNQQMAGQRWAIEEFRQCLNKSVTDVFPELAEEGYGENADESVLAQMEREHQALRAGQPQVTTAPEQAGQSASG